MRVLITGSAGFAGSHLVEYLLEQGQEVVAFVRGDDHLSNVQHVLGKLRIELGDLRDGERLYLLLRETRPERIYHLAAMSSPWESFRDPNLAYSVNFGGTYNLLAAWRRLEMDCRLLCVSSAEVYGFPQTDDLPLREEAALRPASPYGGSKAAAEMLAFQFFQSYGLPIVRVRPFNHTGPRQSPQYVCSGLARQLAEIDLGLRLPVICVGNRSAQRDFTDVRDIVRGYYLLLEGGKAGEVYQLCSGRPVSVDEIVQILCRFTAKAVTVKVDESKLRAHDVALLWGDPSKAKQSVGWVPGYDLETTLRDLKLYWQERGGAGCT